MPTEPAALRSAVPLGTPREHGTTGSEDRSRCGPVLRAQKVSWYLLSFGPMLRIALPLRSREVVVGIADTKPHSVAARLRPSSSPTGLLLGMPHPPRGRDRHSAEVVTGDYEKVDSGITTSAADGCEYVVAHFGARG